MQTSVAALLLVTSAVVISCFVVNYAVNIVEQTIDTDHNPQLDRLKNLEDKFLNENSNLYNQTLPELPDQPLP
jgi:hypothetical protein